MLTLTLRHSLTPLTDQINRLYASFTLLRRRHSWKTHVRGGCAFLEIKIGERDGLWHVHLHVLLDAAYWDQKEISADWHAVTGDSSIVHVKAYENHEMAASYATKYVTKPADSSVFADARKLDEFLLAMKGRKLALPFGTWRKMNLMQKPKQNVKWISLCRVEHLAGKATTGDKEALRWLEAAQRKWPLFAECFRPRPPPEA